MAARFDWSTYLTLAEELGAREDEASLRSAISRAYYFVYHLALQRAEANDFKASPGEPSHRQLWRLFDESPETACKKLGVIATRLKQKRERADYEPVFVRIEEEKSAVLQDARDFLSLLTSLPARHPNPKSVRLHSGR